MANLSNTAYDVARGAVQVPPALFNLTKLTEEKRVTQAPAATIAPQEVEHMQTLETRFGSVSFNIANAIHFARGLLGMPERQGFVLADFPNARFAQFKLLQCSEDKDLSFITMPLDLVPDMLQQDDLRRACDDTGINFNDLAVLLIVTVHRAPEKVTLSVNARAPLLIDAEKRFGVQYVFPHDRYSVQQVIGS